MMTRKQIQITRAAVIAVALAFLVLGVLREEHLIVLKKAVNICLECIGVG